MMLFSNKRNDAQDIPLEDPCWLPAFSVKLRDASKCVCPMRAYKSVTISCSDPGVFEIKHASSGSPTHLMALGKATSDSAGPLEYDDVRAKSHVLVVPLF